MMLYAKRGRKRKHLLAFLHLYIFIHIGYTTHACVVLVCNVNEAKCDEKGRKASSLIYSDLKKQEYIMLRDICYVYVEFRHVLIYFSINKNRYFHKTGKK